MPTAFLVDGGFFVKRYQRLRGSQTPRDVARALHRMCFEHLTDASTRSTTDPSPDEQGRTTQRGRSGVRRRLYRIFYYDCYPLSKKAHHPVTGKAIDFSKTPLALWRSTFFEELKRLRKVALRMGYLDERSACWTIRREPLKRLFKHELTSHDLTDEDVRYDVRQKGVDMKLGLDVAALAYKRLVDQIVLVAGDSDFVPAAKLARREGIDFILDPMWASIRADLHEHIDGLRTVIRPPAGSA